MSQDLCINECQYVNGAKKPYCRLSQKYQMDDDCVVRIKAKKTRTKKCVSKCSNKSEELCKDECKYIKGAQYNYCRLSQKYQMDDDCNVQSKRELKRQLKKMKSLKSPSVKSPSVKSPSVKSPLIPSVKSPLIPSVKTPSVKTPVIPSVKTPSVKPAKSPVIPRKIRISLKSRLNASRKISKFMKKVDPNKRRAYFLNSICSDAGVCIAFGKEIKTIHKHFDGFVNFSYTKHDIKRIGESSSNGFINEITYERNGYIANSILKSSTHRVADNLMFEYIVGQYINKQCKRFPCFVETYGLFKYKNEDVWNHIRDTVVIANSEMKESLQLIPSINEESMKLSCTNSNHLALLIQHIKGARTLKQMCESVQFLEKDLLNVLYQIYMPLSTLANTFTHYDLHSSNILVYEPAKGKYIQYRYILNDGTIVEFKSSYIVKIIDYGRCFFVDDSETGVKHSSKQIYDTICKLDECNPNCGKYSGYGVLAPEESPGSFYYISASTRNMSHDLRLLHDINELIIVENFNEYLHNELEKIDYGVGLGFFHKEYGTKEQTETGTPRILNVIDAHNALKSVIITHKLAFDKYYEDMEMLGTFNIYESARSMEFVPKLI